MRKLLLQTLQPHFTTDCCKAEDAMCDTGDAENSAGDIRAQDQEQAWAEDEA